LATFPLPAGFLLVGGSGPEVDAVRATLVAGRLPREWPEELPGLAHAHAGRLDEAAAAFAGAAPVERFNRFVLDPGSVDVDALRADLPPDLAPLVDVVRYTVGATDTVPEVGDTDAELAALILSSQASAALAVGDARGAVALLRAGADRCAESTPVFAALLRGNAGTVAHEHGLDRGAARADLEAAVAALTDTDLALARAELHHQLATLLHEDAAAADQPLTGAIHHYYSVLQLVSEESAPQLWAAANLSLGTAYLTMPMTQASDTLRSGVAMQALRGALRVFTKATHPHEWAAATVNLANALVYAPSIKQGDNLVEAVELYEEVLALRDRHVDPLGRARVLANQGNALAHLGIFDQAKAKLHESRALFEEALDHDSVLAVRSILDELSRAQVPQGEGRIIPGADGSGPA
jgi:tetratricopeptide (TPR) repeat protein